MFLEILTYLLLGLLVLFGGYLFVRLVVYGAAKSWFQAKRENHYLRKEKENGDQ